MLVQFVLFMNRVVREVNAIVLERRASIQCLGYENCQMFADDTAQVTDLSEKLQKLVTKCRRVYERRKLRVNMNKNEK